MALADATKKKPWYGGGIGEKIYDVTHGKKKKKKLLRNKKGKDRAYGNARERLDEALEGRAAQRKKKARKRVGM